MSESTAPANSLAGAGRLVDYWATVYRRTWKGSAISSFVTPLFYVLAMGVLLGDYVTDDASRLDGASSYLVFIAPGLLAAQAMQTVFGEVTYPVMGMVKWQKTYFGMTATPLSVREVILGHLGFVLFRVGLTCAVFTLVMAPFGVFATVWGAVLAFLVQLLVGLAFATPIYAFSAGLKDEAPFALVLGQKDGAGQVVRGRIDAVYAEDDGYLVVDWKTNRSATADPLQLAIYRLAWAELHDVPLERVRAAFYYVRTGEVVEPEELADRQALEALLSL